MMFTRIASQDQMNQNISATYMIGLGAWEGYESETLTTMEASRTRRGQVRISCGSQIEIFGKAVRNEQNDHEQAIGVESAKNEGLRKNVPQSKSLVTDV